MNRWYKNNKKAWDRWFLFFKTISLIEPRLKVKFMRAHHTNLVLMNE